MNCKYCQAKLVTAEHLPTEAAGDYHFTCGTVRYGDSGWVQDRWCRRLELENSLFAMIERDWEKAALTTPPENAK